jgi:ATP-dependent Clp protease adaptor protein ClpS
MPAIDCGYSLELASHQKEGTPLVEKSGVAVADPVEDAAAQSDTERQQRPKRQPRYSVILWDADAHTYAYVIAMMKELCGHQAEKAFQIAEQVDNGGRAICLTTTREHAELKRDQIHAYGKDSQIVRCQGSMSATIEPMPEGN